MALLEQRLVPCVLLLGVRQRRFSARDAGSDPIHFGLVGSGVQFGDDIAFFHLVADNHG